ncbi:hypothetical protein [Nannocystis punicea]|uniref:Uncharacterized protein n=1 Tax=Nannocystis punicea TaxID=2995304 RepID=A0ABY7GTK5_9BACT|nr:hypothetical protein [Nannocystis poenicansa]WAS90233.1 hypothetical protein O0S08_28900 [Nannocystis poenicansa]
MSPTIRLLGSCCIFFALGAACDEPASGQCPAEVPTRLWASPPDKVPELNAHLADVFEAADTVYFRWGRDPFEWGLYASDLCGDEVVRLDPDEALVDRFLMSRTADFGLVVFGYRRDDAAVVQLDRLEVAGIDVPVEVGRFVGEKLAGQAYPGVHAVYFTSTREPDGEQLPAAGVGSRPLTLWRLGSQPGDLLERQPGEFVHVDFTDPFIDQPLGAGPSLTLTDAGELHLYDLQGVEVAAIDQVRYAQLAPGGSRAVWQQLGDGEVEATFLRDLATGIDRELTANTHTAVSWGRVDSEQRETGTWHWVDDDFLGLVGPERTLVAVHDAAGATLDVPAHTRVLAASPHGFWLELSSDADETVAALWNPRDDELFEWYRQPSKYRLVRLPMIEGDEWHFLLDDQDNYNRGSWWRIDRTTGAWTKVLPALGVPFYELADGRFVTALENSDSLFARLAVVEPGTDHDTTIAEDIVSQFAYVPEYGVYYLDAVGDGLGLWFAPIPEAAAGARSLRAPGLRSGGRSLTAAPRDPSGLTSSAGAAPR